MARMPGAQWRPLPNPSKYKMSAFDIICIHTMVGSLEGTDGYFRGLTNGINSHFGTSGTGVIRQWVDTAVRSGANGNGNHRIISIENEDISPSFAKWDTRDGGAVPALTPAQIEANAQIIAWACRTHGIPCELIPDAKPGRRGIGYHRQGVPGFMAAGAEQWSSAKGKVCPGDRRIAQIPQIIARARQILGGAAPIATPSEENFLSALTDPEQRRVLAFVDSIGPRILDIQRAVDAIAWNVNTEDVGVRAIVASTSRELATISDALAHVPAISTGSVDAVAAGKAGADAALDQLGQVLTRAKA